MIYAIWQHRFMRPQAFCIFFCLLAAPLAHGADLFHPPRKVMAGDKPLDVKRTGHSAPFVGDFDGDGLEDLLVGQFHEGKMRIYRNIGDSQKPKYENFEWFSGKVPSG